MRRADHVICGYCEKEMYVVMTTEVCPNCKSRGGLTFVCEDEPEVEVHESEIANLYDEENVINETEISYDDPNFEMDNIVNCLLSSRSFNI